MKSLCTTALVLLIAINSLHTEQKESSYDSAPKKIVKVTSDHPSKQLHKKLNKPTGIGYTEEPAGVLSQAGNIILPAVKMFQ